MSKKSAITKTQALAIIAIVIVAGVGVGAYVILSQPAPPPKDHITIGWVHALSGPLAPQTTTLHIYYRWIIDDYNKTGGLYVPEYGKKLPIKYIEYDDTTDISKTITYTEKLITEDKVDLIFAPCSTAFCYAVMPLYEQYKMPVIALSFGSDIAGAKMKSGEWQYSFSVLGFPGESGNQTAQVFKYINSTYSTPTTKALQSVGIIYSADQHGAEYASAIASYLGYNGFNVSVTLSYPPYTIGYNFAPLVSTLKTYNPDAIIQCGYVECIFFALQCQIMGYCPKLYMHGPGMETPYLVHDIFGEGGANITKTAFLNACMYYDGWPATSYSSGALKDWAIAHHNRSVPYQAADLTYPKEWPYPASATMYAALTCLFKAVEKVGLDHTKIKDSLRTDTFDTILGKTHLRPGMSMQCELAGTITQWCGGTMMDVIWPLSAASHSIIYPKTGWA